MRPTNILHPKGKKDIGQTSEVEIYLAKTLVNHTMEKQEDSLELWIKSERSTQKKIPQISLGQVAKQRFSL